MVDNRLRRRGAAPAPSLLRGPLRASRVPVRAATQSWIAAVVALALFVLRGAREHVAELAVRSEDFGGSRAFSIEIFAAPKPFVGADAVNQLRAIESWLCLSPKPVVTLLGDAEGYDRVAAEYSLRRIRGVDVNFLGVPLFNSLLAATNCSTADVSVFINADIVLYDDFPYALRKVRRHFSRSWLAVAARWDVVSIPESISVRGPRQRPPERDRRRIVRHVRSTGVLHTYGGIDVWAWNTDVAVPVIDIVVPHFVYGRGKYDNWLTHEAIASNRRAVVDISEASTLIHLYHDYHLMSYAASKDADVALETGFKKEFWNSGARGKFELYINTYLAAAHGSYTSQMGTILHAPYKLTSCYEHEGLCIFQRIRPHSCRCEHSPYVASAQNDPYAVSDSRVIFCGLLSVSSGSSDADVLDRWVVSGRRRTDHASNLITDAARPDVTFGLPLLLEHIVDVIANRTGSKHVVLTTVDSTESSLLSNLACSARKAGVFTEFVVSAVDDELYRYAITHGLPVYLDDDEVDGNFELDDQQELQRVGSLSRALLVLAHLRAVLKVIRLGREVVYVDPDVVLSRNPLHYLEDAVPADFDFAFLSRAPLSQSANARGALSTSVFLARANIRTETFLANVIQRSPPQTVSASDTRSRIWQDIQQMVCGAGGEHKLGENACNNPELNGTRVIFLDRNVFPAIGLETDLGTGGVAQQDAVALQPAFLTAVDDKLSAIRANMLIAHDAETGLCIYN